MPPGRYRRGENTCENYTEPPGIDDSAPSLLLIAWQDRVIVVVFLRSLFPDYQDQVC